MGQDGIVDIATCSVLDNPGLESRGGGIFSTFVQTDPGTPSSLPYSVYRGSPEVEAADTWRYPPT